MEQLKRQDIEAEELQKEEAVDSNIKFDMTNIINHSHNLSELFDILESVSEIEGSEQTYDTKDLVSQIMAVENKIAPLETITKTFGIRDKVFELLDGNVISKEVQEGKSLERIKDAESIDSLKNIFNYVDSVETSLGPVDGKEIADIIQKIEDKEVYIENLTKSHGLRDKVFELLDGDVMSQEAEDQEEINKTKESLVQKDENINIVDEVKEEYESLKSQYQESYEEYRNFLASRPSGLKRALSFFKDKKYMNEMEEKVNSLKSLYQEKEAEYEELKEKVVPFEN